MQQTGTPPVFVKATRNLSQPWRSPVCNSIVFVLFEHKMMSSDENLLNRSYPRVASTTTTTNDYVCEYACMHVWYECVCVCVCLCVGVCVRVNPCMHRFTD